MLGKGCMDADLHIAENWSTFQSVLLAFFTWLSKCCSFLDPWAYSVVIEWKPQWRLTHSLALLITFRFYKLLHLYIFFLFRRNSIIDWRAFLFIWTFSFSRLVTCSVGTFLFIAKLRNNPESLRWLFSHQSNRATGPFWQLIISKTNGQKIRNGSGFVQLMHTDPLGCARAEQHKTQQLAVNIHVK